MGSEHLVSVKVFMADVNVGIGEMVDLGRRHEAQRHKPNRQECKSESLPEWKREEWPYMAQAKDKKATKSMDLNSFLRILDGVDSTVVHARHEELEWL